ncbi:DUF6415 family natural product biosynthesis protein [Streptomyces sp. NPDC053048]|uniref:DUF6415 family natural product biosynthesis protein n=1 Tax=Streptomyces sp. NPDC053048 TaxID=3365694 RepID=UPI0037CD250C
MLFPRTANCGAPLTSKPPRPLEPIEAVISEAIAMERSLPAPARVRTLTARLNAYLRGLAYDVEIDAYMRSAGDPVRSGALGAVREARHRLGLGPGDGYASAVTFARSLGRAAEDLLHHQRLLRQEDKA